MTLHFSTPDAAQAAASKRWTQYPDRFKKRKAHLTCAACGKSYQTAPKNVNPKYSNHYCSDCRKTATAYQNLFESENSRGEKNINAKLTEAEVIAIRELNAEGYKYAWLSRRYKVTRDTIYCICTRRTWKHVA